jgi:hypothetical protein
MGVRKIKDKGLIPRKEKQELERLLALFCIYHNGRLKELSIREDTPEALLYETGVRHKSKSNAWASNKETKNVFPVVPLLFRDKEMAKINRLIGSIDKKLFKYIMLAYGREQDERLKDYEIMEILEYTDRSKWWRHKTQWMYRLYRLFQRERLLQ